jgi:hypothetical protein
MASNASRLSVLKGESQYKNTAIGGAGLYDAARAQLHDYQLAQAQGLH